MQYYLVNNPTCQQWVKTHNPEELLYVECTQHEMADVVIELVQELSHLLGQHSAVVAHVQQLLANVQTRQQDVGRLQAWVQEQGGVLWTDLAPMSAPPNLPPKG